jgi:hypothetical protein
MKMKKYLVLSLITVVSFMTVAPVFAMENEGGRSEAMEIKSELRAEVKTDKDSIKDRIKELAKSLRFTSRSVTVRGTLAAVNVANASAPEVTINISGVSPAVPKAWPTSTVPYPTPSTSLVLKLTDKAPLYRGYWGKMKLSEMAVGDEVRAVVKFNADGTLSVKWLQDQSLHVILRKTGVVQSIDVSGLSFVLKQSNRTVTVKTTAETKFKMRPNNTVTTFSDLKVGDSVNVEGILNSNKLTVAASSIKIAKRPTVTPAVTQ